MKIRKARIAEIIKEELSILNEDDWKIDNQIWKAITGDDNIDQTWEKTVDAALDAKDEITKDDYDWDNEFWRSVTGGDDNISQTAERGASWLDDVIDDGTEFEYDGKKFTFDPRDIATGDVESYNPADSFLGSLTEPLTRPISRFPPVKWLGNLAYTIGEEAEAMTNWTWEDYVDTWKDHWLDIQKETYRRVPGSPPASVYIDDIEFAKLIFSGDIPESKFNKVVYSKQLETESGDEEIFDAVSKFYYNPVLKTKGQAKWGEAKHFPDFSGQIMWGNDARAGMQMRSNAPQYAWLGAKFKKAGYSTKDKVLKILQEYWPAELAKATGDIDDEEQAKVVGNMGIMDLMNNLDDKLKDDILYREGWQSPFVGKPRQAAEEADKIISGMSHENYDSEGNAIWPVYYGLRGVTKTAQTNRDIAKRVQLAYPVLGDIYAYFATQDTGDAKQMCLFVYWTDDPRWCENPDFGDVSSDLASSITMSMLKAVDPEMCMTFKLQ